MTTPDLACGSGAFLLVARRRLTVELRKQEYAQWYAKRARLRAARRTCSCLLDEVTGALLDLNGNHCPHGNCG